MCASTNHLACMQSGRKSRHAVNVLRRLRANSECTFCAVYLPHPGYRVGEMKLYNNNNNNNMYLYYGRTLSERPCYILPMFFLNIFLYWPP